MSVNVTKQPCPSGKGILWVFKERLGPILLGMTVHPLSGSEGQKQGPEARVLVLYNLEGSWHCFQQLALVVWEAGSSLIPGKL